MQRLKQINDDLVSESNYQKTKPGLGTKSFVDLINNVSNDVSSSRESEPVSMQEIRKKIPIEKLRQKISYDQVQSANDLMDQFLQSQKPFESGC